jgi:hypothetical protein
VHTCLEVYMTKRFLQEGLSIRACLPLNSLPGLKLSFQADDFFRSIRWQRGKGRQQRVLYELLQNNSGPDALSAFQKILTIQLGITNTVLDLEVHRTN